MYVNSGNFNTQERIVSVKRHYKISSMHNTNVTDALRCMAN